MTDSAYWTEHTCTLGEWRRRQKRAAEHPEEEPVFVYPQRSTKGRDDS
jgi:hypothetical protein